MCRLFTESQAAPLNKQTSRTSQMEIDFVIPIEYTIHRESEYVARFVSIQQAFRLLRIRNEVKTLPLFLFYSEFISVWIDGVIVISLFWQINCALTAHHNNENPLTINFFAGVRKGAAIPVEYEFSRKWLFHSLSHENVFFFLQSSCWWCPCPHTKTNIECVCAIWASNAKHLCGSSAQIKHRMRCGKTSTATWGYLYTLCRLRANFALVSSGLSSAHVIIEIKWSISMQWWNLGHPLPHTIVVRYNIGTVKFSTHWKHNLDVDHQEKDNQFYQKQLRFWTISFVRFIQLVKIRFSAVTDQMMLFYAFFVKKIQFCICSRHNRCKTHKIHVWFHPNWSSWKKLSIAQTKQRIVDAYIRIEEKIARRSSK